MAIYIPFVKNQLSYEQYMQSLGIDYWWRLDTNFGSGNGPNVGDAGTADLALNGPKTDATYNTSPVTLNTTDGGAIHCNGSAFNWLNANSVRVNGSAQFTFGCWYNIPTGAADQLLFRTNMGGSQGRWRGLDILYPASQNYLVVVLGTNSVSGGKLYYRLNTPAGSFPRDTTNFLAAHVVPTTSPTTITINLYVNGVLQTLTYSVGTGDTIAWPVTNSDVNGWNGIAYGAAGDTYGGQWSGKFDEAFFHWGELTAEQILGIYQRGT